MVLESKKSVLAYGKRIVVPEFSVVFETGTITSIIGANGSGKTTVLKALSRLLHPIGGTIELDGKNIFLYDTTVLARSLAVLPQFHSIIEDYLVKDFVTLGRFPHESCKHNSSTANEAAVEKAIALADLQAMANRPISSLSGGERQRAWIALVLAQEPEVLLLDEPTTYLDIRYQFEILELIRRMNKQVGLTVVMVLHDLNHAARYSDRIIALKSGQVVADGSPESVITPSTVNTVFGIDGEVIPIFGCPYFIPKAKSAN